MPHSSLACTHINMNIQVPFDLHTWETQLLVDHLPPDISANSQEAFYMFSWLSIVVFLPIQDSATAGPDQTTPLLPQGY